MGDMMVVWGEESTINKNYETITASTWPVQNSDENVNSPKHYCLDGLNIETIDVIRSVLGEEGFKNYCRGNVIKYITRADHKNGVEDLKKARVYLTWEIEDLEDWEEEPGGESCILNV